jgi:hypothetical protein
MEEYPEEMRTPPVSLVALVGCPELHNSISTHLHSEQPPINTLALPDFSKISVMAKTHKENSSNSSPPAGILKRDWLLKHRTRIPAVVAVLISSDHVSGDPAQWLQVCTDLENLKAVIRGRNIKLVLIVSTQSASKDDITEDRMIALRKRAEVDSKYVIMFSPDDDVELKQSLNRLGNIFAELAHLYYKEEGRRVKSRIERKGYNSAELQIRYCFKVAVYAEFRRDWIEALRLYEDAYRALREMIGTSTRLPAIQRLTEIKIVAEHVHFKIATLLLHGGKLTDAISWFRQHYASYRKLLGSPEVTFLHWEWVSRQFLVFAELLETCASTVQTVSSPTLGASDKPTEWEIYPAYYYQLAAQNLKEKRSCLELAISMSDILNNDIANSVESVVPSVYVGQFARLVEHGDTFEMHFITDEEYIQYTLAEGKRFQDSVEIIALFKKSYESYNKNLKSERTASYCAFQMAQEHFSVNEFSNAKLLFDKIAILYRQEGWVPLLWETLGYLQECSKQLNSVQQYIEYSLEMAALPVFSIVSAGSFKNCGPAGPATVPQTVKIHEEVMGFLRSDHGDEKLKLSGRDEPILLEIDLVSPLRVVLLASVVFHEQMVKPLALTPITISLMSQLPNKVEIDQLEVQFNQSECNFIILNGRRTNEASDLHVPPGRRVETADDLSLSTNKWLRLTYDVKTVQSGKLECIYVIARIGPHLSICCRAESPASMNELPLWKFEDRVETFPNKDPTLTFSGQKATQVEEPEPLVDLNLGSSGPALVGETFIVPVTVVSRGHAVHSGELKINLVDTRGGGLISPRETDSSDNLYVELLGVSGQENEPELQTGQESIKKIQHSFGLVSVPFIENGGSWSCKLEIRWHRPKPVMLYVSLGYYSVKSTEPVPPKVNVHKSLMIEGKTAVTVSHKYILPFRRDPLLLSKIKPGQESSRVPTLPVNETSTLVIITKNCTEVPLRLLSMSIESDTSDDQNSLVSSTNPLNSPLLVPGEEFKKIFSVNPKPNSSVLKMGNLKLKWTRDFESESESESRPSEVLTKHVLPDVKVESPPLAVNVESPPHGILGDPFMYYVRIHNLTQLLQEIKFSLADSQSFVLSGCHNDTVFVLPESEHILSYKLVALDSGSKQLPRVTVTSVRYSAGFQSSVAASSIFIFPCKPHLENKV